MSAVCSRLDAAGADKAASAILVVLLDSRNIRDHSPLAQTLTVIGFRLDVTGARKATEPLVAALLSPEKTRDGDTVAQALVAVSRHLDASAALKAAEPLVAALCDPKGISAHDHLAKALVAVGQRLDSAGANRLVDVLVAAISKSSNPHFLGLYMNAVEAIGARLDSAGASRTADALVAAAINAPFLILHSHLARGLRSLSGRLEPISARKTASRLMDAMTKAKDETSRLHLTDAILVLGSHIDDAVANALVARGVEFLTHGASDPRNIAELAHHARILRAMFPRMGAPAVRQTADALVAAMIHPNGLAVVAELAEEFIAFTARLDRATAAAGVRKVADAIVASLATPKNSFVVQSLASGFAVVMPLLDETTATLYAGKLANALLEAIKDVPKRDTNAGGVDIYDPADIQSLVPLARCLGMIGDKLDPEHAGKAADEIVYMMRLHPALNIPKSAQNFLPNLNPARNTQNLFILTGALKAVSSRLDETRGNAIADSLTDAICKTAMAIDQFNSSSQTQTLKTVVTPLGTRGIVRALRHPLAAGPVQRSLLELLEKPTRRGFRCTWQFIDWAESNGVDLLAYSERTPPVR